MSKNSKLVFAGFVVSILFGLPFYLFDTALATTAILTIVGISLIEFACQSFIERDPNFSHCILIVVKIIYIFAALALVINYPQTILKALSILTFIIYAFIQVALLDKFEFADNSSRKSKHEDAESECIRIINEYGIALGENGKLTLIELKKKVGSEKLVAFFKEFSIEQVKLLFLIGGYAQIENCIMTGDFKILRLML